MKKVTLPIAAIALVGLYAGTASADCDFNSAAARGVKGSMVRNYAPCPGTEHPTLNAHTEAGTRTCTPVIPAQIDGEATSFMYGPSVKPKGKCDVSTSAKLLKLCDAATDANGNPLGLDARPCHITYVTAKCSGIYESDGTSPIGAIPADTGWTLATLSRATLHDPSNGDMTVIDFPVTFNFSTPSKGKMFIKSSSAEALIPLVGLNGAALPACTSIEVVDVMIRDPQGLPFAKLGQATRP